MAIRGLVSSGGIRAYTSGVLRYLISIVAILGFCQLASADSSTTQPSSDGIVRLPHVQIDTKNKQIRVDCETLNPHMPLEFFCVVRGGQEHESVLRTDARPSAIHFGLLALGLKAGEPAHLDQTNQMWYPPTGPAVQISCQYMLNGKSITVAANR